METKEEDAQAEELRRTMAASGAKAKEACKDRIAVLEAELAASVKERARLWHALVLAHGSARRAQEALDDIPLDDSLSD